LRFGVRAKNIKNRPKINREMTVAELQLLLEKAEKTIEEKEIRIKQLEDFIKTLGKEPPKLDLQQVGPEVVISDNTKKAVGEESDSDDKQLTNREEGSVNDKEKVRK
jgi:kinesin family member 5